MNIIIDKKTGLIDVTKYGKLTMKQLADISLFIAAYEYNLCTKEECNKDILEVLKSEGNI